MTGRTANRRYRAERAAVLAVSDVCWLCGERGADTVDHVVPYSHGGTDNRANLRPAHRSCNSARGNRAPTRFADLGDFGDW
ncbi:HNH endonuclease [Branchiibius cervicis]|uniref:HNH endonuclease n=1 Tax=Branchiibius cervicis TaxID=908252 RepID=A0ABW2AP36_9MICO